MDISDSQWTGEQGDSYPAVYKVQLWVRACAIGIAIVPASLLFAAITGTIHTKSDDLAYSLIAFATAFAIYGLAWAFTAKITICADRFEQRKPFVHRVLPVTGIAGRRYTKAPGWGYPVIVPKTGTPFSIDSVSYGLDRRFDKWFLRLKDLD